MEIVQIIKGIILFFEGFAILGFGGTAIISLFQLKIRKTVANILYVLSSAALVFVWIHFGIMAKEVPISKAIIITVIQLVCNAVVMQFVDMSEEEENAFDKKRSIKKFKKKNKKIFANAEAGNPAAWMDLAEKVKEVAPELQITYLENAERFEPRCTKGLLYKLYFKANELDRGIEFLRSQIETNNMIVSSVVNLNSTSDCQRVFEVYDQVLKNQDLYAYVNLKYCYNGILSTYYERDIKSFLFELLNRVEERMDLEAMSEDVIEYIMNNKRNISPSAVKFAYNYLFDHGNKELAYPYIKKFVRNRDVPDPSEFKFYLEAANQGHRDVYWATYRMIEDGKGNGDFAKAIELFTALHENYRYHEFYLEDLAALYKQLGDQKMYQEYMKASRFEPSLEYIKALNKYYFGEFLASADTVKLAEEAQAKVDFREALLSLENGNRKAGYDICKYMHNYYGRDSLERKFTVKPEYVLDLAEYYNHIAINDNSPEALFFEGVRQCSGGNPFFALDYLRKADAIQSSEILQKWIDSAGDDFSRRYDIVNQIDQRIAALENGNGHLELDSKKKLDDLIRKENFEEDVRRSAERILSAPVIRLDNYSREIENQRFIYNIDRQHYEWEKSSRIEDLEEEKARFDFGIIVSEATFANPAGIPERYVAGYRDFVNRSKEYWSMYDIPYYYTYK